METGVELKQRGKMLYNSYYWAFLVQDPNDVFMRSNNIAFLSRDPQAFPEDYVNTGFHRGHLNPVAHNSDDDSKSATFTLTNAVPQFPDSNSNAWQDLETWISAAILTVHPSCAFRPKLFCTAYHVTGAIVNVMDDGQGGSFFHVIPADRRRVAIPTWLWTAVCVLYMDDSGAKVNIPSVH
jgi:DNA/RNA endonuclease G (NUC1)